jgi:hypothetical protein
MKFIVTYRRKKKKGYSNQMATFLTPEGAYHWIDLVTLQGATNINLTVS